MSKCDFCNKDFSINSARNDFELEFISESLIYSNLSKCLCGRCAIEGINRYEQDIYYEKCESCGKKFDLMLDTTKFSKLPTLPTGYELRDFWDASILCCDCTIEMLQDVFEFMVF